MYGVTKNNYYYRWWKY